MALTFYCRVVPVFFCLFTYFISASANQTSEQRIIVSTNSIISTKEYLASCTISDAGELQDCHEFKTSISLHNPIALSADANSFFVANYGGVKTSGTSFILKCDLPKTDHTQVSCVSVTGLPSAAHITGMQVSGQKLFFIQSYSYPNNVNFNYLRTCNLLPTGRVSACSSSRILNLSAPNPQAGFNKSMNIVVHNNDILVTDHFSRATFKCAILDEKNNTACAPIQIDNTSDEQLFPIAQDIKGEYICQINSNKSELTSNSHLTCCSDSLFSQGLDSQDKICNTLENDGFNNPTSIYINESKSLIYLTNSFNSGVKPPEGNGALSYCQLQKTNKTVNNCNYSVPHFTNVKGEETPLGSIGAFQIIE